MAHLVGSKGQVVIAKQIRDKLGVQPGWLAIQQLKDDHVVVYFVPPEHDRSLKGSLARYVRRKVGPGEEWNQARDSAWEEAAKVKAAGE